MGFHRKLLMSSLAGVVVALALLGCAFRLSESTSPALLSTGNTCPSGDLSDCTACLKHGCVLGNLTIEVRGLWVGWRYALGLNVGHILSLIN